MAATYTDKILVYSSGRAKEIDSGDSVRVTTELGSNQLLVIGAAAAPTSNGQIRYVTGQGFKFYEEGGVKTLGGTLQSAYDGGNTVTLASGKPFTVTANAGVSTAIALNARANSEFYVTGANLSIGTLSTGTALLNGASGATVSAVNGPLTLTGGTEASLESFSGAIYVGGGGSSGSVYVGTGGAREVYVGGEFGGGKTTVRAGTNGLWLESKSNATLEATNGLTLRSGEDLTLCGPGTGASRIRLGTGLNVSRYIEIGSNKAPVGLGELDLDSTPTSNASNVGYRVGPTTEWSVGQLICLDADTEQFTLATAEPGVFLYSYHVVGVALEASDGTKPPYKLCTVHGSVVQVDLGNEVPAGGDAGKAVYLDDKTPGVGTLNRPTNEGAHVVRVGTLVSARAQGPDGLYLIFFHPEYLGVVSAP